MKEKCVTRSEASALCDKLDTLETAFMAYFWDTILQRFQATSLQLQKHDIDICTATQLLLSLRDFVAAQRDNFEVFEGAALNVTTAVSQEYRHDLQRTKKGKIMSDDSAEPGVAFNGKDKFRIETFNVVIDKLVSCLNHRLNAYTHLTENTNERKRTAALLGLPHYLSEDPADVIRICDAHGETLDVAMKGMQVGLLIGHEGALQDAFPQDIFSVAVVVEETIVLHNLKDAACSFAMLMGIIYCVNLEYPQAMKYSFEFLQRVVMKVRPSFCTNTRAEKQTVKVMKELPYRQVLPLLRNDALKNAVPECIQL
ncbi:hypothetical protein SRHO_G00032850 [Serrasalmus rhombeus]